MSLLAIAAKQIFTPLKVIDDGRLLIEDGVIRAVGTREELPLRKNVRETDLGDRILVPGFVDIHIHGGGGHDVMEATPEALDAVARVVLRHGTTSFLPTTLTAPVPKLLQSLEGLGKLIETWPSGHHSPNDARAEPLGIHMEGPFLSPARRGVHDCESLLPPSVELFQRFVEAAVGAVRVLTLAPELQGAKELLSYAVNNGVKVALGHSDATFEQAEGAISAGASHAVHTFNAMRPFMHRDAGILGAVLTDDRLAAEVIADGIHVSAPALQLLLRAKGVSNVLLVTDATGATGMGPGWYHLGEMDIVVSADATSGLLSCRNAQGTLAGSVLTQDRAVRNIVAFTGVTLCEAVRMASWNPARILGLEDRKGCLRPGVDADLVVLNPDGTVVGTMAKGAGNFL